MTRAHPFPLSPNLSPANGRREFSRLAKLTKRIVVFGYHNVGVRCLRVLLARAADLGYEVVLVVTHADNPHETIWFESVAAVAAEQRIPTLVAEKTPAADIFAALRALQPNMIFSFFCRQMLPAEWLALAVEGAYNMHGSLLPKYRGRTPVNWAVLHGETETGATLHEMTVKPDAGAIIAQTAVPILPDDTAKQVFDKVTVAAEQTLWRTLPALLAGRAQRFPNDLAQGSYFGGRTPEDGRIDWQHSAQQVYNLIRATAPPYPGAFTLRKGYRLIITDARLASADAAFAHLPVGLQVNDNALFGICGDARAIRIRSLAIEDMDNPKQGVRLINVATDVAEFQRLMIADGSSAALSRQ